MVNLGTLSNTRIVAANSAEGQAPQTTPVGASLPFYLNTLQGNNGEVYTATLAFHFSIINDTTTP